MMDWLPNFVAESNRIEGINRAPTKAEIEAHIEFLECGPVTIADLVRFVSVVQPDAVLRDRRGLNVRVGFHVASPGGPDIPAVLQTLLDTTNTGGDPFESHCLYETLHPFTDGNGRSGRALWLWMMWRGSDQDRVQVEHLGFLWTWYYQSLAAWSGR